MFFIKVILLLLGSLVFQLIFTEGAWAWGPAIHTVIACRILEEAGQILPAVAGVIQAFPLEYLYGSMAADFFIGKGQKRRDGHSHNWETGFRFLKEAGDEREAAYAYGFFSHLAADVAAHNYFIPNLIHQASTWGRVGHLYWEARADYNMDPVYMRMAREVLDMEQLSCDEMLKSAVGRGKNGLKTRRRIFTQTVKFSSFLNGSQSGSKVKKIVRYHISHEYLAFMVNLSCRLAKDFLTHMDSSPCILYDPIGSRNLYMAGRNGIKSKIFNVHRPDLVFNVDKELLEL